MSAARPKQGLPAQPCLPAYLAGRVCRRVIKRVPDDVTLLDSDMEDAVEELTRDEASESDSDEVDDSDTGEDEAGAESDSEGDEAANGHAARQCVSNPCSEPALRACPGLHALSAHPLDARSLLALPVLPGTSFLVASSIALYSAASPETGMGPSPLVCALAALHSIWHASVLCSVPRELSRQAALAQVRRIHAGAHDCIVA